VKADKYRPKSWSEFVGHAEPKATLRRLTREAKASGEPLAVLLAGPSGVGKSTAAYLMARDLGVHPVHLDVFASGQLTAEGLREVENDWRHTPLFGDGWRGVVIEDVDKTLSVQPINMLLTFLEDMPARRFVALTANQRPTELFGGIQGPFVSRVYPVWFTAGDMSGSGRKAGPAARRLKAIADAEGLNGRDLRHCEALFLGCGCNLRAAIHSLVTES